MNNETIHLELSIDEINLILEGLGELPFRRVFQLIGRIQGAARAQIEEADIPPVTGNGHAVAAAAPAEEVPA
jgi:hypothetical protein